MFKDEEKQVEYMYKKPHQTFSRFESWALGNPSKRQVNGSLHVNNMYVSLNNQEWYEMKWNEIRYKLFPQNKLLKNSVYVN